MFIDGRRREYDGAFLMEKLVAGRRKGEDEEEEDRKTQKEEREQETREELCLRQRGEERRLKRRWLERLQTQSRRCWRVAEP